MQDAVNAYLWLRDTSGDEAKVVVAGDSSAGGLVMSLLLDPLHTSLAGLPPLLIHAASGDAVLQGAQLLASTSAAATAASTTAC